MASSKRRYKKLEGWILWTLAAVFYFYEFLVRVSPSVMLPELVSTFHVDAAVLGAMSAFYLYAYAPMQLPVGLLMDRFGSRRLMTSATAICGIGGIIFALSPSVLILDIGRVFMGLGSAFAYISLVYISGKWFSDRALPFMIGLGTSVGMFGAIFGDTVISFAVENWGWRNTALAFGLCGLLLAALIYVSVSLIGTGSPRRGKLRKEARPFWYHLKTVCKNGQTWINAIISTCYYAATSAFAGLWAPSFLHVAYGMDEEKAGDYTSGIFIGWLIGGPLISFFSMITNRRKPFLVWNGILSFIAVSFVIYFPSLHHTVLFILLIAIGIFSASQVLTYSLAVELNEDCAKGTAAAFTNFLVMLGGAILQPLVGWLLDVHAGPASGIVELYSIGDYRFALTVFPFLIFLGIFLCIFLKPREMGQRENSSDSLVS